MLEKYEENFDAEEFVRSYSEKKNISKKEALAILRREIKKEPYYQDKIKKALKERYPKAVIRKISQGSYSEGGFPDILMIYKGHYFGFEVKRPVVGVPSKLQEKTIEQIRAAGGTAAIVIWPEEAIMEIEAYLKSIQ